MALIAAVAPAVSIVAGLPAVAEDRGESGREKLIGTFKTRPVQGVERHQYLTGTAGARDTASDHFRRDAGDRVFFPERSAQLGEKARAVVAAQAEWLKRHSGVRLTVEGHADDGGTAEQNMGFAAERAEAVRQRLIDEGVEPIRITIVARGREDRVATCPGQACAQQNRRAVTVVYSTGGERIGLERARSAPTSAPRNGPVPR